MTSILLSSASQAATLEQDLSRLLNSHPRLQAETQTVRAAKAAIDQARSGYLPRLDADASYGYEDTDRTELVPAGGDFSLESKSAAISASQNVFEGFRTDGSISESQSLFDQAKATQQSTLQQLLFEGSSTYLSVLRQMKLTKLSVRNITTLSNQLNMEDERVERGSGVAVDVLQAKSRLQIAKERYTAFLGGLQEAQARYAQVFGTIALEQEMQLPRVPEHLLPNSLDEAIKLAELHNPTLQVAQYGIDSFEHRKTIVESNYYPTLDVVARSSYDDDVAGIRGTDMRNSLLVRSRWNLFNGFADSESKNAVLAQQQAAIANGLDTRRRVIEEVKLAWSNLTTSRRRALLLRNAVNIAGEVYDARTRLRDVGKDTALNVLDAENEVFRAQIDAAAAEYDYYTAVYRVLLAIGKLDDSTLQVAAS